MTLKSLLLITVTVNGFHHTIKAALATLSGDNLSAHLIGGFTMSFNSGRAFRYCMATHGDLRH